MKTITTLAVFLISSLLFGQVLPDNTSGTVSDSNDNPIAFASVYEKNNPNSGCITTTDGTYSFSIRDYNNTTIIVCQYVGMITEEKVRPKGPRKVVNFVLVPDNGVLWDPSGKMAI